MRSLFVCLAVLISFSACKNKDTHFSAILSPNNLPLQEFLISPQRDTILKTSHGTQFHIIAGSIAGANPVRIRVQEAITASEILLAGLVTRSGNELLSSDGMINFEAIDATIVKPVEVKMPRMRTIANMQLFKGSLNNKSSINWQNPQPLSYAAIDSACLAEARTLFRSRCMSCHHLLRDGTGPALAQVGSRGPWSNPDSFAFFIRDAPRGLATNPYLINLKARYGSAMASYPDLSDYTLRCLLNYLNTAGIEEETANNKWRNSDRNADTSTTRMVQETTFVPMHQYPTYDFRITSEGWYNIDLFFKGNVPFLALQDIEIDIANKNIEDPVGFILLPESNALIQADGSDGKISFEKDLLLPLDQRVILLVLSADENNKPLYNLSEFRTSGRYRTTITLKPGSLQQLQEAIRQKKIDRINIEPSSIHTLQ